MSRLAFVTAALHECVTNGTTLEQPAMEGLLIILEDEQMESQEKANVKN